jgi:hypothetical protein
MHLLGNLWWPLGNGVDTRRCDGGRNLWVPAVTLIIIIAVIWSAIFTMADKQLPSNSSLRVAS